MHTYTHRHLYCTQRTYTAHTTHTRTHEHTHTHTHTHTPWCTLRPSSPAVIARAYLRASAAAPRHVTMIAAVRSRCCSHSPQPLRRLGPRLARRPEICVLLAEIEALFCASIAAGGLLNEGGTMAVMPRARDARMRSQSARMRMFFVASASAVFWACTHTRGGWC